MRHLILCGLVIMCMVSLNADILERIVVKVNGDIISQTDLEERQLTFLQERNGLVSQEEFENNTEFQKIIEAATPELISVAVDELLLVQHSRRLGYVMEDDQFDDVVENIMEDNNIDSVAAFEAALQQEGMELQDLRNILERQYLVNVAQQVEVYSRITVTDIEAQVYYDDHVEEFTEPAFVTLREVFVSLPMADVGVLSMNLQEQAEQRAVAGRARILAGEDFLTVVDEVSDSPSKANGGLIGPVRKDELAPAIIQALEGLEVGDVTALVQTSQGFQFFKLEIVTDVIVRPFEEVRDTIADDVFQARGVSAIAEFLETLRSEAIIEWNDEQLQKSYENYLTQVSTNTLPSS